MMKEKNKMTLFVVANILGVTAALCGIFSPRLGMIFTKATQTYALHLDPSKTFENGPLASGEGTSQAFTDLGNPIDFAYSGLYALDSGFQSIAPGGYFTNTDPLSGIASMSFTLAEGSSSMSLEYGWTKDLFNVINVTLTSSGTFSFEGSEPNYVKVENLSESSPLLISNVEFAYSCSAKSNPYLVQDVMYYKDGSILGAVTYSGTRSSVEIQSSIFETPVRIVAPSLFQDNLTIQSIFIPSTVSTIGTDAFSGCVNATLYTEATYAPAIWGSSWNPNNLPVKWEMHALDVRKTGTIVPNDYVFEAFQASSSGSVFGLDKAGASTLEIIDDGILGKTLHFESNGSYAGSYLNNPSFIYEAGAKYLVEFDYRLSNLGDTMYFQFTSGDSSKNVFHQFGASGEIGSLVHFAQYYQLGTTSDYVIQFFPGGASALTSFLMDNLKITRVDESHTVSGAMGINDYLKETLDDSFTAINIDSAPTPSSFIGEDANAISGKSFNMVSPGGYNGFYMTAPGKWNPGTYRFTVQYRVILIKGNVWFKYYASSVGDTSLGVISDGAVHTFSFDFSHGTTDNVVMQIFPNDETRIVFDNFSVTRIA